MTEALCIYLKSRWYRLSCAKCLLSERALAAVELCYASGLMCMCTGKSKCRANERDVLTKKSFSFWLEVFLRKMQRKDIEMRKQLFKHVHARVNNEIWPVLSVAVLQILQDTVECIIVKTKFNNAAKS
jgi:hypothetical protein